MDNFGGSSPPDDLVLPTKYEDIHLREIKHSTRRKIALYLNLDVVLNDEIGLEPNYRGLAELAQFNTLEIRNLELRSVKSPTEELLDAWTMRDDLLPTVGNLWNYIKELERFDVLNDAWPFIERDCNRYLERQELFRARPVDESQRPVQVNSVSQSSISNAVPETVHDVLEPGAPKMYDAFVCYNPEGEDLKFVQMLIQVLEVENKLRLFIPWRDDLSGTSHDTICAKLIEKRCRRMIIVLSPRFLESVSCDFQIQFAHSLSPGARNKKLVPIIIERCQVPEILRHVTCCDYTKKDVMEWFWRRLISSLKAKLDLEPHLQSYDDPQMLDTLNFDMSMEVNWSDISNSSTSSNFSSMSSMSSARSSTSTGSSDSSLLVSQSSTSSGHSSSSLRLSGQSSSGQSPSSQAASGQAAASPDYEQIGNVSRSRTSRLKELFRPNKKRPVPPVPNQR